MKKKYITVILVLLFIHLSVAMVGAEEKTNLKNNEINNTANKKNSPSLFGSKKNKEVVANELIVENKQNEIQQQINTKNEKTNSLEKTKNADNKKKIKNSILNEKNEMVNVATTDEEVVASVSEASSIQISHEGIKTPEMNIDQKVLEKEKQLFNIGSELQKSTDNKVPEFNKNTVVNNSYSPSAKALFSLVVLAAMAGLGYWLLKNNKKFGGALKFSDILAKKDKPIQLLQNLPIGFKNQILLLQYKNCEMIVGLSGSQFTLLNSFNEPGAELQKKELTSIAESNTMQIPIQLDEIASEEFEKITPEVKKVFNPIDQVKSAIRTLKPMNQFKETASNESHGNNLSIETNGFTAII